jgi:hypothetical protein
MSVATPLTAGHPVHLLDENGRPYGVKQIDNKIRTSAMPYGYDIAEGNISDHTVLHVFGYNDGVGDTLEDVTELGVDVTPVPASAIAMEMDSSAVADAGTVQSTGTATGGSTTTLIDTDATFEDDGVAAGDFVAHDTDMAYSTVLTIDSQTQLTFANPLSDSSVFASGNAYRIVTAASTGASVVEAHTLNASYAEQSQFVVMNGQTAVALSGTHIRVNNLHVMHKGTAAGAVGNLTLQAVGGATIYAKISLGLNMMLQAHYTVPAGKKAFITGWMGGISSTNVNTTGRVFLMTTADFSDRGLVPGVFHQHDVMSGGGPSTPRLFTMPYELPAKCDLKISAQRTQGAAAMVGSGSIEGWIEDE